VPGSQVIMHSHNIILLKRGKFANMRVKIFPFEKNMSFSTVK